MKQSFRGYRYFKSPLAREAFLTLLSIKDSDIRMDTVYQGNHGIDKGIHIGGSFSETKPLVALFYGKFAHIDIENPTEKGNDIFVLSKGHGIAAMASIFADHGFFDRKILDRSRSYESILNAHPGPILPGVQIATGPLGQGVSAAVGFAHSQQLDECGNTFCLMGDGEIQEGIPWEAFMYAADKKLGNFCAVIDYNHGQNDNVRHLMLSLGNLKAKFEGFGFEVVEADGTCYGSLYSAYEHFLTRTGERPMAIISDCQKGHGGFCGLTEQHKPTMDDWTAELELEQLRRQRSNRVVRFCGLLHEVMCQQPEEARHIICYAKSMNYEIQFEKDIPKDVLRIPAEVKLRRVPARNKALTYSEAELPNPEAGSKHKCSDIVSGAAAAFGRDPKMVTLDADMGLITGLQVGMEKSSRPRAINAGIAESNMMGIAEAFAARGYNAWCSTFGIFFDWRVLRRISVSQQERLETIDRKDGWLSEGHELDITFLSAAANIDTQVNGATHMSIDDANVLMQVPHLKMIDVACPRMMVAVMKWIAQGKKGLVMLRMTRADTKTIYGPDLIFEYGKGYLHGNPDCNSVVITSGRGIYEALEAQKMLRAAGSDCLVADMPSFDEGLAMESTKKGKKLVFAEQNYGFLFSNYLDAAYKNGVMIRPGQVTALSTLGSNRERRHLHSGTYHELAKVCGFTAGDIADALTK